LSVSAWGLPADARLVQATKDRRHCAIGTVGRDRQSHRIATNFEPLRDSDRPISIIDQHELMRVSVNGEQAVTVGQQGKVGQAAADIVLGDDSTRRRVDDGEAATLSIGHQQCLAAVGADECDRMPMSLRECAARVRLSAGSGGRPGKHEQYSSKRCTVQSNNHAVFHRCGLRARTSTIVPSSATP
jgi:hypothetical protein